MASCGPRNPAFQTQKSPRRWPRPTAVRSFVAKGRPSPSGCWSVFEAERRAPLRIRYRFPFRPASTPLRAAHTTRRLGSVDAAPGASGPATTRQSLRPARPRHGRNPPRPPYRTRCVVVAGTREPPRPVRGESHRSGPQRDWSQRASDDPFAPGHEDQTRRSFRGPPERFSPDTPGWTLRVVPNSYPAVDMAGRQPVATKSSSKPPMAPSIWRTHRCPGLWTW